MATKQPILLVIEDVHWCDDTSLEWLHYLARRCAARPLLLLVTYRSEEVGSNLSHWLTQLDRERLAQEFLLARLSRSDLDMMLRAIFAFPRSRRQAGVTPGGDCRAPLRFHSPPAGNTTR